MTYLNGQLDSMTDHVNSSQMEQFCARTLPALELVPVAQHLASCKTCRQLFQGTFRLRRGDAPLSFTLAPEKWLRHEHLDYEQLVPYVEKRLSKADREMIDLHLQLCGLCREDVRSFQVYRQQTLTELDCVQISAGRPTWRDKLLSGWSWLTVSRKPVYATAMVLGLVSAVILLVLLFEHNWTSNQQARQSQQRKSNDVGIAHTGDSSNAPAQINSSNEVAAATIPATNGTPQKSDKNTAPSIINRSSRPMQKIILEPLHPSANVTGVTLNDGQERVVIDDSGNLTGLGNLPPETQAKIKEVLLARNIERPTALSEIAGETSILRGTPAEGPSFKLISPSRTVITNNRPTFNWTPVAGATSYRVQVVDPGNREVADSGALLSTATQWTLTKPLTRGIVYIWVVTAVINGQDVIAPSTSEPEMKFKVLDEETLREINSVQQRANSHLALGVLYARAGMRTEAEREFQMLVKKNPNSSVALQLLHSIQSWR